MPHGILWNEDHEDDEDFIHLHEFVRSVNITQKKQDYEQITKTTR